MWPCWTPRRRRSCSPTCSPARTARWRRATRASSRPAACWWRAAVWTRRPTTSRRPWPRTASGATARDRSRAGRRSPASMRRFAIEPERVVDGRVTFDALETRHLARVLRLGPGDTVIASDGAGHDYTVRLDAVRPRATGVVVGVADAVGESPLAITLVQGVPKAARARGWRVVGLGARILRTETAGPALIAILQSRWGDMGAV